MHFDDTADHVCDPLDIPKVGSPIKFQKKI